MTRSLSSQSTKDTMRHQDLLELVEAENASKGEVGCGSFGGNPLTHIALRSVNIGDDTLKALLREHLGHVLMERDFDSIVNQVQNALKLKLVKGHIPQLSKQQQFVQHIPTPFLQEFFQVYMGELFDEAGIEEVIQFTHQVTAKAVLNPRHTWADPIWVLTTGEKVYISQACSLEDAIDAVKSQYPMETGVLEVVKVGGVLAPNQVICLD